MPNFGAPKFESAVESEKPYTSRIVLNFFRHGEKEKAPPPGMEAGGDREVRLTSAGRIGAMQAGEKFRLPDQGMEQALAKGSSRKRAQETAALVMSGDQAAITGEETLDELRAKLDEGRKYGSKIGTDKRLDFEMGHGDFEKAIMAAAKSGKLFEWLVQESDQTAIDTLEQEGVTYSRAAKNIAEIIGTYLKVSGRFDDLVEKKGYQDTMLRQMGSHQTVTESFLAKAIEKTKGGAERDEFVEAVKNGFGFVEGYEVEIRNHGDGKRQVHLHYRKQDKDGHTLFEYEDDLPEEMLQAIIKEGEELDQKIESKLKQNA